MATEIEVTFAKSQSLPDTVPEGRLQLVDESASATEVEAYVGTQNGAKKITDKDKASIEDLKDGTLVPKLADNLTPYAEDSGTTQTPPFFLEGTATGNGESRVDAKQVPAFAFLQEKRGNMVTVNQLANPSSYRESGSGTGWSFTCNGSKITLVVSNEIGTDTVVAIAISSTDAYWQLPVGHSHLYSTSNSNAKIRFRDGYSGVNYSNVGIINKTGSKNVLPALFLEAGLAVGTYTIVITISDLTQWFNNNIPSYLLSHPEAFGRYYKGSLAYEPGRLEPATGRYLTSVGRNIWDEEWEVGVYNASASTVIKISDATHIRSKNPIRVTPDTEYYMYSSGSNVHLIVADDDGNVLYRTTSLNNGTFITPAGGTNVYFNMAASYGTTYNNDITISLYYPGESGYDKYYPHEVLATIDTGTEPLYSAGSAYDSKVPSGLITRRIGSVDLGTVNYDTNSVFPSKSFYVSDSDRLKIKGNTKNIILSHNSIINPNGYLGGFSINRNGTILLETFDEYADRQSVKAAMSGIMLYYELAEPTTEQGTPFQENIPIDDFGQLSWSNTDVPQGNQIFYPVDYKAYEDTLIKYTDGDATSLVRKTDYASYNTAGLIKANVSNGIQIVVPDGQIGTVSANNVIIKIGANRFQIVCPWNSHVAAFYGLAKAAGADLASSTEETAPDGTNPGVYPAAAKTAIQNMLGITDLIGDINTVLDSVNGVVI